MLLAKQKPTWIYFCFLKRPRRFCRIWSFCRGWRMTIRRWRGVLRCHKPRWIFEWGFFFLLVFCRNCGFYLCCLYLFLSKGFRLFSPGVPWNRYGLDDIFARYAPLFVCSLRWIGHGFEARLLGTCILIIRHKNIEFSCAEMTIVLFPFLSFFVVCCLYLFHFLIMESYWVKRFLTIILNSEFMIF